MKKILSSLVMCTILTLIACNANTRAVKSIYIKPQNSEIFSSDETENIYYYDSNKSDVLVLSAVISQTDGLFKSSKEYKPIWKYKYCDDEKSDISTLLGKNGKVLATTQEGNLILNISDIDRLGSYTLFASAGGVEAQYKFEVDSTANMDSSIKLYYVPEIGGNISDENRIIIDNDRDIQLSCSTTYAIVADDKFGKLEYQNITPESIFLSSIDTGAQEKLEIYKDAVYITTKAKEGESGIIKIKAGNKKLKEYRINTEGLHYSIISTPAPKVKAIPITGGYKVIFTSDDISIFDSYSLVLKINDEEPIRIIDKCYDDNGNLEGVFYSFTQKGNYELTAYFQKENVISQVFQDSLNIIGDIEDSYLLDSRNIIQRSFGKEYNILDDWDMDRNVEDVLIHIPHLANYTEPGALGSNEPTYCFKNARVRITARADDIQYSDFSLNQIDETIWRYSITNNIKCDKIFFDICVYNCIGPFHSISKTVCINVNKFSAKANFSYSSDSTEANKAYYRLSISDEKIISFNPMDSCIYMRTYDDNKLPDGAIIYVAVSEDGGKNYNDLYKFYSLRGYEDDFVIDKPYPKNSDSVVFKVKIMLDLWIDCNLGKFTSSQLKTCQGAMVDYSQNIQDAPNIKKAKITAPFNNGYKVEYLINNSTYPTDNDIWTELVMKNGSGIVDVIKCKEGGDEQKIEKTLWIRTSDLISTNSIPSISSHKISLTKAPKPMDNKSDGHLWKNTGFWANGITLNLHAPVDDCYIRAIAESENAHANSLYKFAKKDDSKRILNDWDQCFAAYRYNRFFIAAYTSKAGYIDSDIDTYSGYERSGRNESFISFYKKSQSAVDKLKKTWRCTYEF